MAATSEEFTILMSNPKVFLSHASEDKARFVVPFATDLRSRGLDVWLDEWEMLPGDSLVKKIFTEGIDQSVAVVVVVSETSVKKPWVAEELDAAVVSRIQKDAKLIPVILDGLQGDAIPAAIRHLVYEVVADVNDFGTALDRVVRAVLDERSKPPLGDLPAYASAAEPTVDGLDRVDGLILKLAGDEAVRDFGDHFDTREFLATTTETLGISTEQAIESLEVLNADGLIDIHRTMGGGIDSIRSFELTRPGLDRYTIAFVEDYGDMQQRMIVQLIAKPEQGTDSELAESSGCPRMLALHVLRILDSQGLLSLSETYGPHSHYLNVSPKLRRMAN